MQIIFHQEPIKCTSNRAFFVIPAEFKIYFDEGDVLSVDGHLFLLADSKRSVNNLSTKLIYWTKYVGKEPMEVKEWNNRLNLHQIHF